MKEMTIQGGNVVRRHGKATSVDSDMQIRTYASGGAMFTVAPGTPYECGIMLSRGDLQRLMQFLNE